ncbi:MAG: C40 family peptidase [Clostridiaceae bacterium]|nr:C40 family peptidase [Clostridiaceae bacterium]
MRILNKSTWKIALKGQLLAGVLLLVLLCGCGDRDANMSGSNGSDTEGPDTKTEHSAEYIYGIPMDENAAVVTENVADIFAGPDVKSERITQVLCNQPVSVIENEGGWAKVKTISGITGWIKSRYISDDVSSITGRIYTYRIIVTGREKTVYSGPNGGITRVDAQMGTEFYAFNNKDDAYEVFLPDNTTGWLKGSGIIRIPVNDAIPVTNADDFAATALRFKGTSFMLNGMSSMGIDSPGLVYICARINGINLPTTIEGQLSKGIEIELDDVKAGDLVFLTGTGDNEADMVSCVGVGIGGGSYIYAGRKTGYVAVGDIYRENPDGVVVAARRIFN